MAVLKRLLRSGGFWNGAEILRFAQDDKVERYRCSGGFCNGAEILRFAQDDKGERRRR